MRYVFTFLHLYKYILYNVVGVRVCYQNVAAKQRGLFVSTRFVVHKDTRTKLRTLGNDKKQFSDHDKEKSRKTLHTMVTHTQTQF